MMQAFPLVNYAENGRRAHMQINISMHIYAYCPPKKYDGQSKQLHLAPPLTGEKSMSAPVHAAQQMISVVKGYPGTLGL